MNDELEIWEKPYIAKGVKEPPESFETFTNHYVDVNPEPTVNDLVRVTGFKRDRLNLWKSKYKYRDRRIAKRQHIQQEKQKAIKKSNEVIAPVLAKINEMITKSNARTIQDTITRQDNLQTYETNDPRRIELHKENTENTKTYKILNEALITNNEFDDYIKAASQDTTVINELLERAEDYTLDESLKETKKLEEEMKDADF